MPCQQLTLSIHEQRIVALIYQHSIEIKIDSFLLVFDDSPGQYATLDASMINKDHFALIILHRIVEIMKGRIVKACKFNPQRHHVLTAKLI